MVFPIFFNFSLNCAIRNGLFDPQLAPGLIFADFYTFSCKEYDQSDFSMTSLVAQMVKHLSTMRETWVQSLGQEDLLEKEMATHSSILAWKIPWMEEPGRLQSMGLQRVFGDIHA